MHDDYSVRYEKRHTRHGLIMDGDCWEVVRILTAAYETEEIVAVVATETMADDVIKMLEDE